MPGPLKSSVGLAGSVTLGRLKALSPDLSKRSVAKTFTPNPLQKAQRCWRVSSINHPWMDGNKRTGLGLALFLLRKESYTVNASQDELYDLTIGVAEGRTAFDQIKSWFVQRIVRA